MKRKQKGIDTNRIRALHTDCRTVAEIARTMKITASEVEESLKGMGYKPIYVKDKPEPNEFVLKQKKRSEKA